MRNLGKLPFTASPAGTDEAIRKLDLLQAEVCLKCGADKVVDLPKEPNLRRERLIDLVEDYLERG